MISRWSALRSLWESYQRDAGMVRGLCHGRMWARRNLGSDESPLWFSFWIIGSENRWNSSWCRCGDSCRCRCCSSRAACGESSRAPPRKERSGAATGNTESRATRSLTRTPTALLPLSSWSLDTYLMTVGIYWGIKKDKQSLSVAPPLTADYWCCILPAWAAGLSAPRTAPSSHSFDVKMISN